MQSILLIEDSIYQRSKLALILRAAGYQVLQATNGKEGLYTAVTGQPDCLVLDLIMPEMNGFEVLESLRTGAIRIPAIVLTADIQDTTREHCLSLGASAVINKPVRPEELMQAIQQAIGSPAGQEA